MVRRGLRGAAGALAVASGLLAACTSNGTSPAPKGALDIVLETDLALPKDLDRITLSVEQGGRVLLAKDNAVGPGALLLPASFEVGATSDSAPATIHAVGYKDGQARVERDAITPIPSSQVGTLYLPLAYLCEGTAQTAADGGVTSTCPDDWTCITGACAPSVVPPSSVVPTSAVADDASTDAVRAAPGCFDVAACFAQVTPAALDTATCSVALPPSADPSSVNVALQFLPGGMGVCGSSACWVSLTEWTVQGSTIQLPAAACRAASDGASIVVSTACHTQTNDMPPCGAWSSVTMPAPQPSSPGSNVVQACDGLPTMACGRCGTQTRSCSNGMWSGWSACAGEGACSPGDTQACGSGGTQSCGDDCQWAACACPAGQLTCGNAGDCASPEDARTCGACGNDCTALPHVLSSAVTCASGGCVIGANGCAPGFADCNGDPGDGCEADLSEATHCGACQGACSGATPVCAPVASGHACQPSCAAGEIVCAQSCVEKNTDEKHCGGCNTACTASQTCVSGACGGVCGPGQVRCSGQQPQSCGPSGQWTNAGSACGASSTCIASTAQCGGVCGPGQVRCNGQQPQSCGPSGQWTNVGSACGASNTCVASTGQCGGVCGPGQVRCNGQQPQSCGPSGQWTNAGSACDAGHTCLVSSGSASCGGACGPGQVTCSGQQPEACGTDGLWHANGAGCGTAVTCIASTGKCGGTCGPGQVGCNGQQPLACDGTGTLVASGSACSATTTCLSGACGGECGPTQTQTQACGTCNTGSQTRTCSGGAWGGYSTCVGGTDLQNDSANCGSCGNACAGGGTCSNGVCPEVCATSSPCTSQYIVAASGSGGGGTYVRASQLPSPQAGTPLTVSAQNNVIATAGSTATVSLTTSSAPVAVYFDISNGTYDGSSYWSVPVTGGATSFQVSITLAASLPQTSFILRFEVADAAGNISYISTTIVQGS